LLPTAAAVFAGASAFKAQPGEDIFCQNHPGGDYQYKPYYCIHNLPLCLKVKSSKFKVKAKNQYVEAVFTADIQNLADDNKIKVLPKNF
jgi:hypothetical protein